MNSRMSKYYADTELDNTRYGKNEELYKEISKSELDSYEVKSNTTILGDNKPEIDVEKIKQILDTKYNVPKRKSIRIEEEPEVSEERETTKEYDINVILERAREEKEENYEEERLKKLRDTQFDILKNLDLDRKEDEEESEEENLKHLIDTIALNESKNTLHNTSLDILSELKGSGNTEVLDGLKEELNESLEEIKPDIKEEKKEKDLTDTKMINSFYTSSNALKDKDFEDIDDFKESIESNNILIKVVIGIIAAIFIVGIVIIVKNFYFS